MPKSVDELRGEMGQLLHEALVHALQRLGGEIAKEKGLAEPLPAMLLTAFAEHASTLSDTLVTAADLLALHQKPALPQEWTPAKTLALMQACGFYPRVDDKSEFVGLLLVRRLAMVRDFHARELEQPLPEAKPSAEVEILPPAPRLPDRKQIDERAIRTRLQRKLQEMACNNREERLAGAMVELMQERKQWPLRASGTVIDTQQEITVYIRECNEVGGRFNNMTLLPYLLLALGMDACPIKNRSRQSK